MMNGQWHACEKVIAFADGEYLFRLPLKWLAELEAKCDAGIGQIYARVLTFQHSSRDVVEVIRCGLIGGGCEPARAHQLVETYVEGFPLEAAHQLAIAILAGCVHGYEPDGEPAPAGNAAAAEPDASTSRPSSATAPSSASPPPKQVN